MENVDIFIIQHVPKISVVVPCYEQAEFYRLILKKFLSNSVKKALKKNI